MSAYKDWGVDERGINIGSEPGSGISNCYRFYSQSLMPANKKFYYAGPRSELGWDSGKIMRQVIDDISREIYNGNCTEISLVGWSRGAAIITEIAEIFSCIKSLEAVDRKRYTSWNNVCNPPSN